MSAVLTPTPVPAAMAEAAAVPTAAVAPLALVPTQRPRRRFRNAVGAVGFALLGLAVFVGLWWLIAASSPELPTPIDAVSELSALMGRAFDESGPFGRGILLQLGTSLGRTLQGFGYAAAIGIPLGLFIGGNRRAWQAANPVIQLLRPISPLAWFPLGLVVLKDSPAAAVFVIFITALWPTVLNTASGAASVPVDQRNVARVFRLGRVTYWRRIMVPHAMPQIVTGLRLSMGTAWMVIVAAEMLSGGSGIGFFVWDSYNGGNLSAVVAAVIVIGAVGIVLDQVFVSFGRRFSAKGAP